MKKDKHEKRNCNSVAPSDMEPGACDEPLGTKKTQGYDSSCRETVY